VEGFTYSAGLKSSGITWTDATLERWLSDPDMVVKDNNMSIAVPKAGGTAELDCLSEEIEQMLGISSELDSV
jgi:cytochrome c2